MTVSCPHRRLMLTSVCSSITFLTTWLTPATGLTIVCPRCLIKVRNLFFRCRGVNSANSSNNLTKIKTFNRNMQTIGGPWPPAMLPLATLLLNGCYSWRREEVFRASTMHPQHCTLTTPLLRGCYSRMEFSGLQSAPLTFHRMFLFSTNKNIAPSNSPIYLANNLAWGTTLLSGVRPVPYIYCGVVITCVRWAILFLLFYGNPLIHLRILPPIVGLTPIPSMTQSPPTSTNNGNWACVILIPFLNIVSMSCVYI
jgi:hypothetical protein